MRSANKNLLQEAAQWLLAGAALFLGIYFFDDIKTLVVTSDDEMPSMFASRSDPGETADRGFSGVVRLKADRRGHFVFPGKVDGRTVTFMADTGASIVALTYEDARRAGLSPANLDFSARVSTANGVARVAPVTLSRVRVGSITLRNVPAAVAEKGALDVNLLGMSFLGRLESFNLSGDELVLNQ
ncbi:retropepsin-like aspartic protease family protein [Methyloceanibacter caenitepidi]|uniref:CblY, a non-orthologous displasment for Alpha-ribazole-5'-phosphate phosphatase n=1 Tax=Methyloceanibacter caenitepidi TaxID=1384459 RepID=A0A0A8K7I7_9HYPH|nr:TIGR02281 family clan AA aspartic protease [Methyloceanibacter caenitepidi]BAQ17959.1 CblY, a non-orthologous displasment for Alpha-ribazole-5'-phosphate phosphatase [Methyloceanibacter caenitepidi]